MNPLITLNPVVQLYDNEHTDRVSPNYTDEQNNFLMYGDDLKNYDLMKRNLVNRLNAGIISKEKYNNVLMKINKNSKIQKTQLENYQQATKDFNNCDKVIYNAYKLMIDGNWDKAKSYFDYIKPIHKGNMARSIYKSHNECNDHISNIIDYYNAVFTENGKPLDNKTITVGDWYFEAIKTYCINNGINSLDDDIFIDDSSKSITIRHNKKSFIKLANIFKNIDPGFEAFFLPSGSNGRELIQSGRQLGQIETLYKNVINKYNSFNANEVPIHSSLDYIDDFAYISNNSINFANGVGSFQEMQNYMDRVTDNVKAGETKFNNEEIYKTFYNQLIGTHPANFPVWTINGNEFKKEGFNGEYEINTNDDHHKTIMDDIAFAMQKQKDGIMIRPVEDGINYGHIFYIPARNDENPHAAYSVFIPNFFEKNAINKYKNDLRVQAKDEIKLVESYGKPNYKKSVIFQNANCQGAYQIKQDFNGNKRYIYTNESGKEFDLNNIFGNEKTAKTALWQVVTAQYKLNDYTEKGVIPENWFNDLMRDYNNVTGMTLQDILSILGEQSVDDTRQNLRNAYRIKFK